ncbi:MAG TPA: AtpZ/AtpI family protein [Chloroflexota bacterium]|jgi:F0F1-type ATP synthase assembly protein I|nr:AtpZ/AtpI family protein [Chloroflexota bacterium]
MARSPVDRNRSTISVVQSLAVASYFGVSLAVSVVLGYLAGQWVDGRLGTGIIFTLIGVLLGLVAATTSAVKLFRATLERGGAERHAPKTQTTESAPDVANDSGGDE